MTEFTLWAGACSHVDKDLARGGRESLAEAIRQSEGRTDAPGFDWDLMLHLGDTAATQTPPGESEGREVVRQFGAAEDHRREQIYNLVGNHDATGPTITGEDVPVQRWFRRWIDPTGEHPDTSGVDADERPYPIEGTWERYAFEVGNVRFLVMGDRNDGAPPAGRGQVSEGEVGGYPAGAVTEETFEWWRDQVEANPEKIVVTCHHHVLKDTTVASGEWEGIMGDYHGYFPDGAPEGAGYLYFVGDEPDADRFESYLRANPGAVDLWLGGHTHAAPGDRFGGKTHVERKWGVTFVNVAPLTRYHAPNGGVPHSRVFTFTDEGRWRSMARLRCYLHTDDIAPVGWYDEERYNVPLSRPFEAPG